MADANGSHTHARQVEIIRRLAAREAARRQAQAENSKGKRPVDDLQSNVEDADQLDAETLAAIVSREKSRNDVAWAWVKEQTDLLGQKRFNPDLERGTEEDELKAKETELAALDFEIDRLSKELPSIEEPYSDGVAAILTRATVASAIEQYEAALQFLQSEYRREQELLEDERNLLRQLSEVKIGLKKRDSVLSRRQKENDLKSIERRYGQRLESLEAELAELLRSLIDISQQLFSDEDDVKGAQLRHLTDRLINKAWDTPADPYVNVADDYVAAIPAFLLRANVAVEHPRDAHRLRLIDFHRTTVA